MEGSRNVYTEPMGVRLRKAFGFLFHHVQNERNVRQNRRSQFVDVGKSAARAAEVRTVIVGLDSAHHGVAEPKPISLNRSDSEGTYLGHDE